MFLLVQPFPPQKATARRNRPLVEYEEEKQKKRKRRGLAKVGKVRVKGIILYPLILAGIFGLLAMANTYQKNMVVKEIQVDFFSGEQATLIDAEDAQEIVGMGEEKVLIGETIDEIQLAELEDSLRKSPFVADAEVFKSLLGVLHMEVELRKPVARIINNSGTHLYVDAQGNKFPTTRKHTAYVPLIRGDFDETVVDTFACSTIESAIPVVNYIVQDSFWNAQIAEIVIQQSGALVLHQQVGEMKIEFGQPVRIEEKFLNLMDFYRQVLPEVGWKYYRTVDLKYKGQVIGRKR